MVADPAEVGRGKWVVYSIAEGKSRQLTDGMSDARYPVFDADGKHLYFTASTDSGPSLEADIRSAVRPPTRSIYVVVLSPATKPDAGGEESRPPAAAPKPAEVHIDWDRINQRILALPLPARRCVALQVGKAGNLFALEEGTPVPGSAPGMTVHRHDLSQRRSDVIASGVRSFEVSANGEKTLTAQGDHWTIQALRPMSAAGGAAPGTPPPPGPPGGNGGPGPFTLKTEEIEIRSDPRAEWKQMY